MKTLMFLLQVFIACCVFVKCSKDNCGGYEKARWSMSMKEVKEIYGDLKSEGKNKRGEYTLSHKEKIEGVLMEVSFIFLDDKLVLVNLHPVERKFNQEDYEKIKRYFLRKHGEPNYHHESEVSWETKDTFVELRNLYAITKLDGFNYSLLYESKEFFERTEKKEKEYWDQQRKINDKKG